MRRSKLQHDTMAQAPPPSMKNKTPWKKRLDTTIRALWTPGLHLRRVERVSAFLARAAEWVTFLYELPTRFVTPMKKERKPKSTGSNGPFYRRTIYLHEQFVQQRAAQNAARVRVAKRLQLFVYATWASIEHESH